MFNKKYYHNTLCGGIISCFCYALIIGYILYLVTLFDNIETDKIVTEKLIKHNDEFVNLGFDELSVLP